MAEKIIGRIISFQKKIFPTLFVCSAVIISISYSIETTAINIGWWKWNIDHQTFKDLFIGGYSLRALEAWLFFTMVFLAAFFLIECSKYRDADWKSIFIVLPFIYSWAILRIGPREPSVFREITAVIVYLIAPLIFSSFLSPLSFKYGKIEQGIFEKQKKSSLILKEFPSLIVLFMLLVVACIDLFILKSYILLISAIPVIFVMLLSIKKIPFYIVFILSSFILFLGKEKMIIPTLPAIVVFVFWVVNIFKIHFLNKESVNVEKQCIQ
ncbi:MAG: hypothetical protein Q7O04_01600 [Candidatus Omnitrophota bacterium]|nr:hypothetical protein [Candidatus Omnitrophota bacterium]